MDTKTRFRKRDLDFFANSETNLFD